MKRVRCLALFSVLILSLVGVALAVPDEPSNPQPGENSVSVPLNPTFRWNLEGFDPATMHFQFYLYEGIGTGGTLVEFRDNWWTESYYLSTPLNEDADYSWQVVAVDGTGATSGDVWSFHTQKPQASGNREPYPASEPTPADLSDKIPLSQVLSWTGGDPDLTNVPPSPLYYSVEIGTDRDSMVFVASGIQVNQYAHELDPDTTYYWRITTRDGLGAENRGPIWSFTTVKESGTNQPPTVPVAVDPTNGATNVPVTKTLRWGECTDPDEDTVTYDVYLGTNAASFVKVASDLLVPMFDLPGTTPYNTVHYWKVVAKDSDGLSTSGSIWSFTTEQEPTGPVNHAPNAPVAVDPTNGATGVPITKTLRWEGTDPDGDTLAYDVYLGTNAASFTKVASDLLVPMFDLPGTTPYNTVHYWMVVAKDPDGLSTSGAIWTFTTETESASSENHAPNSPVAVDPTNGATGVSLVKTLRWEATDPDGDTPLHYDLWIGSSAATFEKKASNLTTPLFDLASISPVADTLYYWQIEVRDPDGASTLGPIWTFRTAEAGGSGSGTAPNVPSNFDPADKATSVPTSKSFTWTCTEPDGQALTYEVWMGRNLGDFTLKASGLTNPLYTPSSKLGYNTTYYWKIVAVDPDENRTETPILSFTTFTEAEDPNLEGGLSGGGCSAAPLGGLSAMALMAGLVLIRRRR